MVLLFDEMKDLVLTEGRTSLAEDKDHTFLFIYILYLGGATSRVVNFVYSDAIRHLQRVTGIVQARDSHFSSFPKNGIT